MAVFIPVPTTAWPLELEPDPGKSKEPVSKSEPCFYASKE